MHTTESDTQLSLISGPCEQEASSDPVTAPLGDLDAIPYLASSSSLNIVSGRLPLSSTVSSKIDLKGGHGIIKPDDVDKQDGVIIKDGNNPKDDNNVEGVSLTQSTAKKQRLTSPGFSGHILNKHGVPFHSTDRSSVQSGARPPDTRLERSLRKDGEDKDSLRKLPASRADRLRAPCPPTEHHARERERSRSVDR